MHTSVVDVTPQMAEKWLASNVGNRRLRPGMVNRYSHDMTNGDWDDVRLNRVLPFRESRDEEDEKHVHPLQLDVIDRIVTLWSNPGERVFTPFMGVGSEVYSPVRMGRMGIGAELKPSYYRQAVKNVRAALTDGDELTWTALAVADDATVDDAA